MKERKSNALFVAIGTLVFYMAALPIIDAASTFVQTFINSKTVKLQYTLAQDQEEISEIADRVNSNGPVQAIGFQIDSGSCEQYEE